MKYIYFIVYAIKRGYDWGAGSAEVTRYKKIKSIEELQEIEKSIKKDYGHDEDGLLIINYKLMRKEGGEE